MPNLYPKITIAALVALTVACGNGSFTDKRDGQTYRTVKIGEQAGVDDALAKAVAKAEEASKLFDTGTLTDHRDGKTYKTVKIGGYTWMAENLNYGADSSLCYDNDVSNCNKYGRLYYWKHAKTACPDGWRLPANEEWETLWVSLGGKKTSESLYYGERFFKVYKGMEEQLESKDGFAALLGGEFGIDYHAGEEDVGYTDMGYSYCWFNSVDEEMWWWHPKERACSNDYGIKLGFMEEVTHGCSVRCIQN